MNIEQELSNKKEKHKKKKNIVLDKFKYYSQEINIEIENNIPEEYGKIKEQLYNIDLNNPSLEINKEELSYLEKITKEQCLEIIKEELEESSQYKANDKLNKEQISKIINQLEKKSINISSDEEKDICLEVENKKKEENQNLNIKTENNDLTTSITENLNEKYKFYLGTINWNNIIIENINSKKLTYNNIGYYKSATDYNNYAYFTCNNNKRYSKKLLNKKICYSHIKLNKIKKEAFLTKLHEEECLIKNFGNITIMPSINKIIKNRDDVLEFAEKLLYLNNGISLITFKEIIYKFISIKKYSLNITEEYLKNYFYNWRNKNKINSYYYAHDNQYTLDNKIFLQILEERIIPDHDKNKLNRLIYLIWASPFHINRMRNSPHFYLDFTFIKPYPMIETLVLLYLDLYTGIKSPGLFVTLNSKKQICYEYIFRDIKNILTSYGKYPLALKTYTIDYEKSLENALQIIFPEAKRIGCFFHYVQSLVRWMKNNGLGKKEKKEVRENIIYILTILLFKYKSDMEYVKNTINNLKTLYTEFLTFFQYYENNWYEYLENSMLDYNKVTKLQRCNSYIENYNKIIKNTLGKGKKLSWPKFVSFLKEQENNYSRKIIDIEKTTNLAGAKIYEILRQCCL